ncbi:KinB signaling pathway activation protein [Seinonella peptonophila]|uniref:KinB signaling pathway activation protein n=1 Tax=Seinonella peptonophila TaxID=112248 RepID=A0A1M4YXW5_9BACL|nr:KinB-signaling pathway activation protein [Seinonella peptonophila]SHF10664.1 KinB signaling pathway activation protein [Seinonella peptonophila]
MQLKTLWFWFWTTLLLGTGASLLMGFVLQPWLGHPEWIKLLLTGMVFGAVAELGLFSYLVFNWLCRGLIQSQSLFHGILVLLTALVLGNLFYLLSSKYDMVYLIIIAYLVLVSVGVAWLKAKETNRQAWIPTIFFVIVVTTLEAMTSINPKGASMPLSAIFYTVTILLICNAWQILRLHHWVKKPKKKASTAS